jgi:hypothetical protein
MPKPEPIALSLRSFLRTSSCYFLLRFLCVAGFAIGVNRDASAGTILYEGFSDTGYILGASVVGLDGGTGFDGPWVNYSVGNPPNPNAITSGLSFTHSSGAALATSGNALSLSGVGLNSSEVERKQLTYNGTVGTSVWFSFLLRKDTASGSLLDLGVLKLIPSGSAPALFIGDIASSARLSLLVATSPNVSSVSTTTVTLGQTYFLVGRLNFNPGVTSSMDLFVNPEPGSLNPGTPAVTLGNLNVPGLSYIHFATSNQINGASFTFDELRIGDTFADVSPAAAPEMSSATFLLMALGMLGSRRPKR